MKKKLVQRRRALKTINWSAEKKAKMEAALLMDLTSSDEEEATMCQDVKAKKQYQIRTLPWESAKLSRRKKQLDSFYMDHVAGKRQLSSMPVFARGDLSSTRAKPTSAPEWTMN